MKRTRSTQDQVIGILKEHQAAGTAAGLCHRHGISDMIFYIWRSEKGDGHTPANDAVRWAEPVLEPGFHAGRAGQRMAVPHAVVQNGSYEILIAALLPAAFPAVSGSPQTTIC
ncbi:transposase [Komagataeibacter europaeus]|uniref:transposase n=1 Tax=Komagataeibacter europaeus TaxID=33995 RepID=UPI00037F06F2|nr:transposase [Komagataeibacter europaeus]